MNIFILDLNHETNASFHCDRHVVKMILEQNQLLTTAHHMTGTNPKIIPYKKAFYNHPCAKWTRDSLSNYNWLIKLTEELIKEYEYRYGKVHKCTGVLEWCKDTKPNIIDIGQTPVVQAMPNKYRSNNIVEAYRDYFNTEKRHLFSWKKRPVPYWVKI